MRLSLARALSLQALCLVLGLVMHIVAVHAQSSLPAFPVKLSADGTYLVDQNNKPFFMNGDTAWSLIAQLSQSDADLYLSNRATKGFNVVLVSLIERTFADRAPANISGAQPFSTPGNFNTPNETYFAHADWVIKKAAEKGVAILLAPLYLGYQCGSEGWCSAVKNSSLATLRNYGRYVGNRYKSAPNIIWLIGGDAEPIAGGVEAHVREFVAGLREMDANHLITAHNAPEQAAMDVWPSETWLSLNNVYTYSSAATAAATQYSRASAKPFFLVETFYEREHASTPLSLRRQAYWTVLSGGRVGHVFGNCPIWNFGATNASWFCSGATWQSQLESAGSITLAHVGRLFGSRPFQKLVPDLAREAMTSGHGSGDALALTARASDGSTIIAYIPTQRTVTIAMSKVGGGSAKAWWFNPRTAAAALIGTYPATGSMSFSPPDSYDWVLVIDNATLNLAAPGSDNKVLPAPTNLRIEPYSQKGGPPAPEWLAGVRFGA